MIDKAYQRRGFGKEAVQLALDFIKSFPCGKAEYCWLSYEPNNEVHRLFMRNGLCTYNPNLRGRLYYRPTSADFKS
jgi:ribosomal protein S18 acetylase RimI-like enzyme